MESHAAAEIEGLPAGFGGSAPLLPKPVGCAILGDKYPEGHYFSFGHPEGNNCTWDEFGAYLASIWGKRLGTQNGCTFDIPVAQHWFNLPERDPLLTEEWTPQSISMRNGVPSVLVKVSRWQSPMPWQ